MTPEELGRELREDNDEFLQKRRIAAGLSLFSIAAMALISLYQIGVLKHLPEPPIPGLDADRVNGSAQAYELFAVPDGVLGLGSYAATLGLTAMGGARRAQVQPLLPLLAAGKTLLDSLLAAKLTADQKNRHRAYCLYCLSSAAATLATLILALPEARAAWRNIHRDD